MREIVILGLSDQEFESIDLSGEVPDVICAECAASGIVHTSTSVVAFHCKHAERGGWRIYDEWMIPPGPVRAEHFWTRLRMVLALAKLQLAYEQSRNRRQH